MKPKRLISLLVAVCMMITMLPLSAVTAFAADTASSTVRTAIVDGYKYEYKVNEADNTATITKFLGPDGSAKSTGSYDIKIPEKIHEKSGDYTVTAIGNRAFWECTSLKEVTIPQSVTSIGDKAFYDCRGLTSVTIPQSVTSIGDHAFDECIHLKTLSFGENSFGENIETNIKTIGNYAFFHCNDLESVTIPQSVTSIGREAFRFCNKMESLAINGAIESMGIGAFAGCISLKTLSLGENIKMIGNSAFDSCTNIDLTNVTIPEKVTTIGPGTFSYCTHLEYIMLPAGLTTFKDKLIGCPAGNPNGAIYYKNYKAAADALLADNDDNSNIDDNHKLRKRNFLYLCKVTFDAKGGKTDYPEVPVYKTEKITDTKANDLTAIHDPTRAGYKFTGWYTEDGKDSKLFNVKDTAIMEDITLHAGWEFDPNAPGCHPLTVTGGTVTVKYDGSDVTSKLRSTDATTGQKTYYVPQGAEVTVKLDKNTVHNGKVFDGWSTTGNLSLLTGQDSKAETITFTMNSDAKVSAKYRDAAADHTHDTDTAVCHPLTVTGGIVTVKKGDKDVTDTLTVTTDEATGKKTYSVPDGATVTVTLDKTLVPEGMVFDIWSTGKFSLPLGQDYKAESITFTMNTMSSDADIAAQYRDSSIEDDGPNVLGTAAIIGTAAVGGAVLGYQAYSLGAEFAGKLMALPYFPSNRSALAMMLWEDAGKPMPESELLYPDVGQEEQDMDLQHAARWAMENELIPDLNDEGTAPEEMKFFPANPVSKLDVLNAWQKAQELKNN